MGIKKIKLTHRRNDCIGCGVCSQIDPPRWEMNQKDGKVDLQGSVRKGNVDVCDIDSIEKEKAKECERSCPMGIIRVEE
jgi:ferredoxin